MCCNKKFPIFELESVKNLLTRGARTSASLLARETKAARCPEVGGEIWERNQRPRQRRERRLV